jgi:hypothetical protein
MKKQTAVEWLMDKLPTIDKYDPYYEDIIQQAKAMEKVNSEISFFAGYNYEGGYPIDEHEEYYTQTYGKSNS